MARKKPEPQVPANLIVDVQACKPQQSVAVTQAATITDRIVSNLPS